MKSIFYVMQISDGTDLFHCFKLSRLRALFIQTVVLGYFWSGDFNTKDPSLRLLRFQRSFKISFVRTRYGRSMREYYVPDVFNNLPSEIL